MQEKNLKIGVLKQINRDESEPGYVHFEPIELIGNDDVKTSVQIFRGDKSLGDAVVVERNKTEVYVDKHIITLELKKGDKFQFIPWDDIPKHYKDLEDFILHFRWDLFVDPKTKRVVGV